MIKIRIVGSGTTLEEMETFETAAKVYLIAERMKDLVECYEVGKEETKKKRTIMMRNKAKEARAKLLIGNLNWVRFFLCKL